MADTLAIGSSTKSLDWMMKNVVASTSDKKAVSPVCTIARIEDCARSAKCMNVSNKFRLW